MWLTDPRAAFVPWRSWCLTFAFTVVIQAHPGCGRFRLAIPVAAVAGNTFGIVYIFKVMLIILVNVLNGHNDLFLSFMCWWVFFMCIYGVTHIYSQRLLTTLKGWLILKKGVWRHTTWQKHEGWCVWTPLLLTRRDSWSHQSATLLVSQLTQIEFMGDTCRMFPSQNCITKQSKDSSSQQIYCRVYQTCKMGPAIYLKYLQWPETFFNLYLVRQMLTLSIISATVAVFPSLCVWGGCVIFLLITDQSVTEPCLEQWAALGHVPARHFLSWLQETGLFEIN